QRLAGIISGYYETYIALKTSGILEALPPDPAYYPELVERLFPTLNRYGETNADDNRRVFLKILAEHPRFRELQQYFSGYPGDPRPDFLIALLSDAVGRQGYFNVSFSEEVVNAAIERLWEIRETVAGAFALEQRLGLNWLRDLLYRALFLDEKTYRRFRMQFTAQNLERIAQMPAPAAQAVVRREVSPAKFPYLGFELFLAGDWRAIRRIGVIAEQMEQRQNPGGAYERYGRKPNYVDLALSVARLRNDAVRAVISDLRPLFDFDAVEDEYNSAFNEPFGQYLAIASGADIGRFAANMRVVDELCGSKWKLDRETLYLVANANLPSKTKIKFLKALIQEAMRLDRDRISIYLTYPQPFSFDFDPEDMQSVDQPLRFMQLTSELGFVERRSFLYQKYEREHAGQQAAPGTDLGFRYKRELMQKLMAIYRRIRVQELSDEDFQVLINDFRNYAFDGTVTTRIAPYIHYLLSSQEAPADDARFLETGFHPSRRFSAVSIFDTFVEMDRDAERREAAEGDAAVDRRLDRVDTVAHPEAADQMTPVRRQLLGRSFAAVSQQNVHRFACVRELLSNVALESGGVPVARRKIAFQTWIKPAGQRGQRDLLMLDVRDWIGMDGERLYNKLLMPFSTLHEGHEKNVDSQGQGFFTVFAGAQYVMARAVKNGKVRTLRLTPVRSSQGVMFDLDIEEERCDAEPGESDGLHIQIAYPSDYASLEMVEVEDAVKKSEGVIGQETLTVEVNGEVVNLPGDHRRAAQEVEGFGEVGFYSVSGDSYLALGGPELKPMDGPFQALIPELLQGPLLGHGIVVNLPRGRIHRVQGGGGIANRDEVYAAIRPAVAAGCVQLAVDMFARGEIALQPIVGYDYDDNGSFIGRSGEVAGALEAVRTGRIDEQTHEQYFGQYQSDRLAVLLMNVPVPLLEEIFGRPMSLAQFYNQYRNNPEAFSAEQIARLPKRLQDDLNKTKETTVAPTAESAAPAAPVYKERIVELPVSIGNGRIGVYRAFIEMAERIGKVAIEAMLREYDETTLGPIYGRLCALSDSTGNSKSEINAFPVNGQRARLDGLYYVQSSSVQALALAGSNIFEWNLIGPLNSYELLSQYLGDPEMVNESEFLEFVFEKVLYVISHEMVHFLEGSDETTHNAEFLKRQQMMASAMLAHRGAILDILMDIREKYRDGHGYLPREELLRLAGVSPEMPPAQESAPETVGENRSETRDPNEPTYPDNDERSTMELIAKLAPTVPNFTKILIVDDDPNQTMFKIYDAILFDRMQGLGVELAYESDRQSAENYMSEHPEVGMIITDLTMPETWDEKTGSSVLDPDSGLKFLRGLRERGNRLPAIIVSNEVNNDGTLGSNRPLPENSVAIPKLIVTTEDTGFWQYYGVRHYRRILGVAHILLERSRDMGPSGLDATEVPPSRSEMRRRTFLTGLGVATLSGAVVTYVANQGRQPLGEPSQTGLQETAPEPQYEPTYPAEEAALALLQRERPRRVMKYSAQEGTFWEVEKNIIYDNAAIHYLFTKTKTLGDGKLFRTILAGRLAEALGMDLEDMWREGGLEKEQRQTLAAQYLAAAPLIDRTGRLTEGLQRIFQNVESGRMHGTDSETALVAINREMMQLSNDFFIPAGTCLRFSARYKRSVIERRRYVDRIVANFYQVEHAADMRFAEMTSGGRTRKVKVLLAPNVARDDELPPAFHAPGTELIVVDTNQAMNDARILYGLLRDGDSSHLSAATFLRDYPAAYRSRHQLLGERQDVEERLSDLQRQSRRIAAVDQAFTFLVRKTYPGTVSAADEYFEAIMRLNARRRIPHEVHHLDSTLAGRVPEKIEPVTRVREERLAEISELVKGDAVYLTLGQLGQNAFLAHPTVQDLAEDGDTGYYLNNAVVLDELYRTAQKHAGFDAAVKAAGQTAQALVSRGELAPEFATGLEQQLRGKLETLRTDIIAFTGDIGKHSETIAKQLLVLGSFEPVALRQIAAAAFEKQAGYSSVASEFEIDKAEVPLVTLARDNAILQIKQELAQYRRHPAEYEIDFDFARLFGRFYHLKNVVDEIIGDPLEKRMRETARTREQLDAMMPAERTAHFNEKAGIAEALLTALVRFAPSPETLRGVLAPQAPLARSEMRSVGQHEFMPQPTDGFALKFESMVVYGAPSETARTDAEGLLSAKMFYRFEGRFAPVQERKITDHIAQQGSRRAYAPEWKKHRVEITRLNKEINKEQRPEVRTRLELQRKNLREQLQTMFREDKQCPPDFVLVPLDKLSEMENERLNSQHEGPVGGDNLFALALDAADKGRDRIEALDENSRLRISAASLIRFVIMVENAAGEEMPHVLLMLMSKRFMETGEARYIPVGGGVLYAVDYPEDWEQLSREHQLEILKEAPLRRKLETEFGASDFEGDNKKLPVADMRFQAPVVVKATMRGFEISRRNFDALFEYMQDWERHQDELESPLNSARRETGEELVDELKKFGRHVFESQDELFGTVNQDGPASQNIDAGPEAVRSEMRRRAFVLGAGAIGLSALGGVAYWLRSEKKPAPAVPRHEVSPVTASPAGVEQRVAGIQSEFKQRIRAHVQKFIDEDASLDAPYREAFRQYGELVEKTEDIFPRWAQTGFSLMGVVVNGEHLIAAQFHRERMNAFLQELDRRQDPDLNTLLESAILKEASYFIDTQDATNYVLVVILENGFENALASFQTMPEGPKKEALKDKIVQSAMQIIALWVDIEYRTYVHAFRFLKARGLTEESKLQALIARVQNPEVREVLEGSFFAFIRMMRDHDESYVRRQFALNMLRGQAHQAWPEATADVANLVLQTVLRYELARETITLDKNQLPVIADPHALEDVSDPANYSFPDLKGHLRSTIEADGLKVEILRDSQSRWTPRPDLQTPSGTVDGRFPTGSWFAWNETPTTQQDLREDARIAQVFTPAHPDLSLIASRSETRRGGLSQPAQEAWQRFLENDFLPWMRDIYPTERPKVVDAARYESVRTAAAALSPDLPALIDRLEEASKLPRGREAWRQFAAVTRQVNDTYASSHGVYFDVSGVYESPEFSVQQPLERIEFDFGGKKIPVYLTEFLAGHPPTNGGRHGWFGTIVYADYARREAEKIYERIVEYQSRGETTQPEDILYDRQWGDLVRSLGPDGRDEAIRQMMNVIVYLVMLEEVRHSFNEVANIGQGFIDDWCDEYLGNLAAIVFGGAPYYALGFLLENIRESFADGTYKISYMQGLRRAFSGATGMGTKRFIQTNEALRRAKIIARRDPARLIGKAREAGESFFEIDLAEGGLTTQRFQPLDYGEAGPARSETRRQITDGQVIPSAWIQDVGELLGSLGDSENGQRFQELMQAELREGVRSQGESEPKPLRFQKGDYFLDIRMRVIFEQEPELSFQPRLEIEFGRIDGRPLSPEEQGLVRQYRFCLRDSKDTKRVGDILLARDSDAAQRMTGFYEPAVDPNHFDWRLLALNHARTYFRGGYVPFSEFLRELHAGEPLDLLEICRKIQTGHPSTEVYRLAPFIRWLEDLSGTEREFVQDSLWAHSALSVLLEAS
ncbi:MAG: hypothetical protein PHN49_06895, partial [Candidatus Omnitrophica bacterium]|nr:hypothetical protein [Candidatus Omnitrophota bacterium]